MKVKDCMCEDVCLVKPNTKVYEVIQLMRENHVGSIPVCDDENQLCGILTDRDILLRAVACDKNLKQITVSDIMSCDVSSCKEEESIQDAQNKMAQNQVRRLPVCDENNQVIGMLTLGDLAQNDEKIGKEQVCTTISNICCDSTQAKNAE